MKMNMGGASFAVQLISYHVGLIKHMMKKFMLNTVHSVHGKLYIWLECMDDELRYNEKGYCLIPVRAHKMEDRDQWYT